MRHRIDGRLFGRTANQRKELLKGLVNSLQEHERIETTVAKAKEVKRIAEKVITLGIKGDLHSKRLAFSYLSTLGLRTLAAGLNPSPHCGSIPFSRQYS